MRLPISIIMQDFTDSYNLQSLVDNQEWVYFRIDKVMYGLKQAGIIANEALVTHMAPFGYHPVKHTPGVWVHDTRPTIFSLVVDDLCVQYSSMDDATHFLNALKAKYLITVDMEGKTYIGIKLHWDYIQRTVFLSIPNYVRNAIYKFRHTLAVGLEYSPYTCTLIQYGQNIQYSDPPDTFNNLSPKATNIVQQVCGTFLYYAIAIDNTILTALSDITSQ